jgi:hypothetical protein
VRRGASIGSNATVLGGLVIGAARQWVPAALSLASLTELLWQATRRDKYQKSERHEAAIFSLHCDAGIKSRLILKQ